MQYLWMALDIGVVLICAYLLYWNMRNVRMDVRHFFLSVLLAYSIAIGFVIQGLSAAGMDPHRLFALARYSIFIQAGLIALVAITALPTLIRPGGARLFALGALTMVLGSAAFFEYARYNGFLDPFTVMRPASELGFGEPGTPQGDRMVADLRAIRHAAGFLFSAGLILSAVALRWARQRGGFYR